MENTEPYLQVGVKVVLQRNDGSILLLRPNPKKYPEIIEKWGIVGGRINTGVSLIENLKREVEEETGLKTMSEPVLLYAQDILNVEKFPGRHIVRLTYKATVEGEPNIDEESLEYKWFTKEELKSLGGELDRFFKEVLDKNLI